MKYRDGQAVMVGDRVHLSDGSEGVVVFCVDSDEYSSAYPKEEWRYLASGAMVKTENYGLLHYPADDDELVLVARGSAV